MVCSVSNIYALDRITSFTCDSDLYLPFSMCLLVHLTSPSCRHHWLSVAHPYGIDKGFNSCFRLKKRLPRQKRLCHLIAPRDSCPKCNYDRNSIRMLRDESLVFSLQSRPLRRDLGPGYLCAGMWGLRSSSTVCSISKSIICPTLTSSLNSCRMSWLNDRKLYISPPHALINLWLVVVSPWGIFWSPSSSSLAIFVVLPRIPEIPPLVKKEFWDHASGFVTLFVCFFCYTWKYLSLMSCKHGESVELVAR